MLGPGLKGPSDSSQRGGVADGPRVGVKSLEARRELVGVCQDVLGGARLRHDLSVAYASVIVIGRIETDFARVLPARATVQGGPSVSGPLALRAVTRTFGPRPSTRIRPGFIRDAEVGGSNPA